MNSIITMCQNAKSASRLLATLSTRKKNEALLKRVIEMATEPGDWVLDSFAT